MPTGTQIITRAVLELNIIDDGGSISASEQAGLLTELNAMVDAWSAENTLVPSIASAQYPLSANVNPYSFGPITAGFTGAALLGTQTPITSATNANPVVFTRAAHGLVTGQTILISGFTANWTPCNAAFVVTVISSSTFSIAIDSTAFGAVTGTPVFQLATTSASGFPPAVTRPVRVDEAYIVSGVGAATNRNKIDIVASKDYFSHNDLSASGSTPDELYLDYADAGGLMKAYFFPVPTCPTVTSVEMEAWSPIGAFAAAVNQPLPPGYEDAIVYGLAFRCIARYGAVINPAVAQAVTALGQHAEMRVRQLNVQNRLLDPSTLPQPAQQPQAAGR